MTEIPVEIWHLARDEQGHDTILLRDEQGRLLPILIGACEAAAIWVALSPEAARPYVRRPWSHDLVLHLIERLTARLTRAVIDGYSNQTYLATLYLQHEQDEVIIDARPSDVMALLLRAAAPLYITTEIMDEHAFFPGQIEGDDDDLPDMGGGLA